MTRQPFRMDPRVLVLLVAAWLGQALALGPELGLPEDRSQDLASEVSFNWEVGVLTNLVVNGGFESGVAGWGGNIGTIGNPTPNGRLMVVRNAAAAAEGSAYGSLQVPSTGRNVDVFVFQQFAIPNIPSTVRLTWKDLTVGGGSSLGTYRVQVIPSLPTLPVEVVHEAIAGFNSSEGPWIPHSADLTAYLGRTVLVEFGLTNRFPAFMGFRLDDVRLEMIPTAPLFEFYLGTNANLGLSQRLYRGNGNSFTASGLQPGTTYFWRVDEVVGTRRAPSPVRTFRTEAGVVPPTPPRLSGRRTGDGGHHLAFATESGRTYRIQRSSDLVSSVWEDTGDSLLGDGQEGLVTLPEATEQAVFFRVVAE